MPIIHAVNGIVEAYPVKPVAPQEALVNAVDRESARDRQPARDHALVAAQHAYEEQTKQARLPRPVMLARDLMTAPVFTLPSDSTIAEAWTVMTRRSIRHLPITSVHGALVGMVSERDLIRQAPELVTTGITIQAAGRKLAEIMTSRVFSATPTTDIHEIARVMLEERIGAIPILDQERRPVGILTKQDLLRGLANHAPLELWT